jgi:hypothetical protein
MASEELNVPPLQAGNTNDLIERSRSCDVQEERAPGSAVAAKAVFEAWLERKPIPEWICPGLQPHSPSLHELPGLIANYNDDVL